MLTPRLEYVELWSVNSCFLDPGFWDQTRVMLTSSLANILPWPYSKSPDMYSLTLLSPDIFPGCRASPGPSPAWAAAAGAPSPARASWDSWWGNSLCVNYSLLLNCLCLMSMVDINVSEFPMMTRWTSLSPSSRHLVSQSHQDNDCHRGGNFGKSEIISAMSTFVLTYLGITW